ncbi:hypothetical protein Glove_86g18 [Diversispora epigaea]|uniref:Protein kinase domain-containing protein n=1 Tax=Diversispora epigaea TaxID=1348612 RepID=A0A397JAA3_9GLOM|nr:hypothetical protein Glove_86g18 [Diversispora epigaea]
MIGKPCNWKNFQNDFNNWTSGKKKIAKLIQDSQLSANYDLEVIEWIPYDRFKDVKQIGKGGFGTIHYARWIDGYIDKWDIENQQWKRYGQREVALKKFDNFVNFNDVLNEIIYGVYLEGDLEISDLELSKLIGTNPNNPEKKNIIGVLPYIAS